MTLQHGQQPQTLAAGEINPATGRPYRLRTWRRILTSRSVTARRSLIDDQARAAQDRAKQRRADRNSRSAAIARGEIGAGRVPAHLRDVPTLTSAAIRPDEHRKERDRSLSGKDRIRARKAARRAGVPA